MTLSEAEKILSAKAECERRKVSGTNKDCIYRNCYDCNLCYEQGMWGEQIEALELVAKALKDSQEQMDIASESVKTALLAHCFNCGLKEGIQKSEASSPTEMSGTSDMVSRQYLLDEYDRQHVGPPGGTRKIIEEAPSVEVPNNPVNNSEIPNGLDPKKRTEERAETHERDLISRQAAIDAIKTWGLIDGLSEGLAIEILADAEKLPPAEPDRRNGKWVPDDIASDIFRCSKCGCDAPVDSTAGCEIKSNFCPWCGADMRGGKNDDPE